MKKIGLRKTSPYKDFQHKVTCSPVTAEIDGSNPFGVARRQVEQKLGVMVMLEEIIETSKRNEISTDVLYEILGNVETLDDFKKSMDDYIELDLISINDASVEFNIPYSTIGHWVTTGKIRKHSFKNRPGEQGRPFILIYLEDLKEIIDNPPKMGRPKKTF